MKNWIIFLAIAALAAYGTFLNLKSQDDEQPSDNHATDREPPIYPE